jgi:hypothetical protein
MNGVQAAEAKARDGGGNRTPSWRPAYWAKEGCGRQEANMNRN